MRSIILLVAICATAAVAQPPVRVASFYGDRPCAISYTFDDGLQEHFTLVRPRLNALGLKATFCIIGSKVGKDQKGTPCMTWEQLREMASEGHEITSHGYAHLSMERLSGEALRYEVQHNDTLIYNQTGVFPRTYFFPGNRKTAEGLSFISRDRVGSRTTQVSLGSKRDSLWLAGWVQRLLKRGEWGVTMTHGITTGYDCFPDSQVLWHHLEQVAAMQDRIWVATFHDVAAYVAERDSITLDIRTRKNDLIVTPRLPLDSRLFCHPLTLVVDAVATEVRQDKKKLPFTIKEGRTLVDFNPHGGKIELLQCNP